MSGKKILLALFCLFLLQTLQGQNGGRGQSSDALSRMGQNTGEAQASDGEFSPLDEYLIGRALGARILARYRPLNGRVDLDRYLNRICEALVINSPNPVLYNGYHVMILDSPQINAYATPGGHIFVTLALINLAGSEDALAAVLAHEIAHIQLRHGLDAIANARTVQELRDIGNEAARRAGQFRPVSAQRQLFEASIRAAVDAMLDSGYAQSQEFDADSLALQLLARAGYQPQALLTLLETLRQRQGAAAGGFNSTHPSPALRISNAERNLGFVHLPPDTRGFRMNRFRTLFR